MNLRNLEQIQERDGRGGSMPFATLLLAAIAGGGLVVVAMTTFSRERPPERADSDALDRLLAEQPVVKARPAELSSDLVTFPSVLSDGDSPTTALATVKDARGRLLAPSAELVAPPVPSAEADGAGLPRQVLPAGDLLRRTPVTEQPKDELTQLTVERLAESDDAVPMAPQGSEGGYEIQVASFQAKEDAEAFAQELRKRGHRAYHQAAYVPDRGLWHRVRVGSFKNRYEARRYQKKFEKSERISTFLVDPEKMKRQQETRDAKARSREQKKKKTQLVTAR